MSIHTLRTQPECPPRASSLSPPATGKKKTHGTDLNGDGFPDIVVPCESGNSINIFANRQGAGFEGLTPVKKSAQCPSPYQVMQMDVDLDGRTDIGVVGNGCIAGMFNQSQ